MVKKGDTLVEVTLAIGIFSMIAIAVASVMSGGTASAQLALETTLAKEEIDTQAEAIRFVHANYIANKDNPSHPYVKLWKTITNKAINILDYGNDEGKMMALRPRASFQLVFIESFRSDQMKACSSRAQLRVT